MIMHEFQEMDESIAEDCFEVPRSQISMPKSHIGTLKTPFNQRETKESQDASNSGLSELENVLLKNSIERFSSMSDLDHSSKVFKEEPQAM